MKNSIINVIISRIEDILSRVNLFLYIFRKERVHHYFLILVFLMFLSAIAFFAVEAEFVIEATESIGEDSIGNRILAMLYWSIVTISTTGYGDIIPNTQTGRALVIVMLFFSIGAVSLFTANLASALTNKKLLESRGIMEIAKLKNHFVICGWKNNMGKFLEELTEANPSVPLNKITIIANIEPDEIELFRQNFPQYKQIVIVRGDHYNETLLRKTNIGVAKKVLVLSDETSTDSSVGIDSVTVLTAMTVRSISMNVSITAELTDVKFEKHFRNAYVDEIIYKNEYSVSLMANSLQQVGLTKIINDLLINHQTATLLTKHIPEKYYGKEFKVLKSFYSQNEGLLLIGLLENVGNLLERKKEAIRSAQKTADVSLLVSNLKTAKGIENNRSNLLPANNYIIPHNSLAIVIEKTEYSE